MMTFEELHDFEHLLEELKLAEIIFYYKKHIPIPQISDELNVCEAKVRKVIDLYDNNEYDFSILKEEVDYL